MRNRFRPMVDELENRLPPGQLWPLLEIAPPQTRAEGMVAERAATPGREVMARSAGRADPSRIGLIDSPTISARASNRLTGAWDVPSLEWGAGREQAASDVLQDILHNNGKAASQSPLITAADGLDAWRVRYSSATTPQTASGVTPGTSRFSFFTATADSSATLEALTAYVTQSKGDGTLTCKDCPDDAGRFDFGNGGGEDVELDDFWGDGPPPEDMELPIEPSPESDQYVMYNLDNDNGGPMLDQIPQTRDFEITGPIPNENDLVPLERIDDTPPPYEEIASRGYSWYRLDVNQVGDGAVKVWSTSQKDQQLPVGSQTTVGMTGYHNGFWWTLPGFFNEGVQQSASVGDVSISLTVGWDVNTEPWISHFRTRTVTVTPIVKSFMVTVSQPTQQGNGLFGQDRFNAVVDARGAQGRPYYINNLKEVTNNISGPPAHGRVEKNLNAPAKDNRKWKVQSYTNIPDPPYNKQPLTYPDENTDYWFLDRKVRPNRLDSGEYYPVYWDIPASNALVTNNDGTYSLKQYDSSGFRNYGPDNTREIDVTKKFRLYLVFEANDAQHSILPLGYVDFQVRFHFDFALNQANLSEPNTPQTINYVASSERPTMMKPLLANEGSFFVTLLGA